MLCSGKKFTQYISTTATLLYYLAPLQQTAKYICMLYIILVTAIAAYKHICMYVLLNRSSQIV